jgi:DNA-binding NtrC family response regulator
VKRELDMLVGQMHADGVSYDEAVREFKRRYLLQVLVNHRGNQCKAAEELGMHRNTLSRTLSELNMDTTQIRNGLKRPARSERNIASPQRIQPIARVR